MSWINHWRFLKGYLSGPRAVGSLTPSSRALARAVCGPFKGHQAKATLLEIGAGTGAITRHIGTLLRDGDEVDICEVNPYFADILERDILTRSEFASRVAAGRVRLFRAAVQDLSAERRYDYVISGLPLTAFELEDVEAVFRIVQRSLKPGGIFSYFEYAGLRRFLRTFALGSSRRRVRSVSALLSENIRHHQFECRTVLLNLPPARTRHLRFDRLSPAPGCSTTAPAVSSSDDALVVA